MSGVCNSTHKTGLTPGIAGIDLKALRRAAETATPGPWRAGSCGDDSCWCGTVECDSREEGVSGVGSLSHHDAVYIAAANPWVMTKLLDRIEALESSAASIASSSLALVQRAETAERERDELRLAMDKQGRAAIFGMNAAKQNAAEMERNAIRLHAESSPDALASERAANAILTEEADELRKDALRMHDALPELDHVIKWLANGCSVEHAVEELSIYKARIDAAMAQEGGK